jgi:hypothetical protein
MSETQNNSLVFLIAIGSKSQVGKDTLADLLLKYSTFCRISFAEPVYRVATMIQGEIGKEQKKDGNLLQWVGDGLKLVYNDPSIWVPEAEGKVVNALKSGQSVVITDLRYKAEWKMIKKYGFVTVRVNKKDRKITRDPNHKSEVELDESDWDYVINNDEGIEELEEKAKRLYDFISFLKKGSGELTQ